MATNHAIKRFDPHTCKHFKYKKTHTVIFICSLNIGFSVFVFARRSLPHHSQLKKRTLWIIQMAFWVAQTSARARHSPVIKQRIIPAHFSTLTALILFSVCVNSHKSALIIYQQNTGITIARRIMHKAAFIGRRIGGTQLTCCWRKKELHSRLRWKGPAVQ